MFLKLTLARDERAVFVSADHIAAIVPDIWGNGTGVTRVKVDASTPCEFDVVETEEQIMRLIKGDGNA